MYGNPFSPYWWMANPGFIPQNGLRRIDIGGIYELSVTDATLSTAATPTLDLGVSQCAYNALPCESVVLLKVYTTLPEGSEGAPVNVNSGSGTTSTSGTTAVRKVALVDSQNTQVTGADLTANTERLAYINKRTGVFRLLEYTAQPTTAATAESDAETQAVASKSK